MGTIDDMFRHEDDDLDFELDMDDDEEAFGEDDEFGLLGIALTDKARAKKWAKKFVDTMEEVFDLMRSGGDPGKVSRKKGDLAKAMSEFRSTKSAKGQKSPASYLVSIGEMTKGEQQAAERRYAQVAGHQRKAVKRTKYGALLFTHR